MVTRNPTASLGWYDLGLSELKQNRTEEAVAHFRKALELRPDYADAHNNLGAALLRLGRAREALPYLEEAGRLNPEDPMPHYNLGRARAALGDPAGAEAGYREALRLKPDYAAAAIALAALAQERGRAR